MCEECTTPEMYEIICAFVSRFPDTRWRDAHIVVEDFNLEDHHIRWCLEQPRMQEPEAGFLRWLLTVPPETRGVDVS